MTNQTSKALRRFNHRHEEIVLWVLLNPDRTQRQVAKDLGYSEGWISTLMASDMFRERLAELRQTYHATAFVGVRSKTEAAANMALSRLIEVLEKPEENAVTPGFYLEAATKLLEKMPGAESQPPGGGIQVNVNVAEEIQQAMVSLRHAKEMTDEVDTSQQNGLPDEPRVLEGTLGGQA